MGSSTSLTFLFFKIRNVEVCWDVCLVVTVLVCLKNSTLLSFGCCWCWCCSSIELNRSLFGNGKVDHDKLTPLNSLLTSPAAQLAVPNNVCILYNQSSINRYIKIEF